MGMCRQSAGGRGNGKRTRSGIGRRKNKVSQCMNDESMVLAVLAVIVIGLIMVAWVLLVACGAEGENWIQSVSGGFFAKKPLLVIDAGHGGIDGGAVSADGVSEKDINLSISLMVRDILAEYDVKLVMTREEDKGLYTGVSGDGTGEAKIKGKRSIRSLKTEDLKKRRALSDELVPDAFVSIHLNSYKEDRTVYGAQTFYSAGADKNIGELSRMLAETIQSNLIVRIDNKNDRVALEKNDVLILKDTSYPAVIVECGFLSNSNEAALLQTYDYQRKIGEAVADGIVDFLKLEKKIQVVKDR